MQNKKLWQWLNDNQLDYIKINDTDFNISSIVGLFHFIGFQDVVFDESFTFIQDDINAKCDYFVYYFGTRFYYLKNNETELLNPKLNQLKYLGIFKNKTETNYINLGLRASYELGNGLSMYEDYLQKSKFLNHKTIGICEKNTLAGTMPFQTKCLENKIKPVFGETVTILHDNKSFDIKLYVKNKQGWKSLLRINSFINVFNEGQNISLEQLKKHTDGLYCVLDNNFDWGLLVHFYDFENIFYQIDCIEYSNKPKDLEYLKNIKNYIDNYSDVIEPILISDTHYIDSEYYKLKKIINGICGSKIYNESKNQHYKSINEFQKFKQLLGNKLYIFDLALENTNKIAEECDFTIDTSFIKLPKYYLTDEQKLKYNSSRELFDDLIEQNFKTKVLEKNKSEIEYRNRLNTEIDIISRGGFIDYFLILWDILSWCKKENIYVGLGRGSAGGSLVSYLLQIVKIDPIEYDLLFERFLNEGRFDSAPDVDVDIERDRRNDVKRYMEQRFGQNNVASIATYTTLKIKSGLKDIAREFGKDVKEINSITKYIDENSDNVNEGNYDITKLFLASTKDENLKKFVKNNLEIVELLQSILKTRKTKSVHAGGVIITPEDYEGKPMEIFDWMPVRKDKDGNLLTEWEGVYLDKCKFIKEDILGIVQLDKINNIIKLIKENKNVDIDITQIPLDDKKTFELFSKGLNCDVFQFNSEGLINFSVATKPETIEHLIAMSALYRPGPMESNAHNDFAKIKNGLMETNVDIGMEDVTGVTFGLWIYQEQLMIAFKKITDCDLKTADDFRRILTKFSSYVKQGKSLDILDEYYLKFEKGYIEKYSVSPEYAKEVWAKIASFCGYGFNKSHSVSYSITSYITQYLKANYPLEFYATSLQFAEETDVPKIISEINRVNLGIELLPPDINKSTTQIITDSTTNKIYWSMDKIKFLSENSIGAILDEKSKNGNFYSFEEFCKRVPKKQVNKRVKEYLIMSGAFDECENITKAKGREGLIKKINQTNEISDLFENDKNVIKSKKEYWWLIKQKESCGYGYINYNALVNELKIQTPYSNELDFQLEDSENSFVSIGGIVQNINKKKTKNGDTFCELKLDSNNEILHVIIWPQQYTDNKTLINSMLNKIIIIEGDIKFNNYKMKNVLYTNDKTTINIFETQ